VHRFGGLLVGSLISLHVLTIAADSFLPFSVAQLLVPFAASYRPLWTGLGIVAAELLLALAFTNRYRDRLSYTFWRRAHYLNFVVWSAATFHGMFAGTDRSAPWFALLYASAVAAVAVAALWRFAAVSPRSRVAVGTALGSVAVLPFLLLGPLAKNAHAWDDGHVEEQLAGQVVRNGTEFKQIVSFVGSAPGPQKLLVRADLLVEPRRLDATSLQLEYLPSGDVCRGRVTAIGGASFSGTCTLRNGQRRYVDASWAPTGDLATVAGTIRLHA
jgi:hypothetical protein